MALTSSTTRNRNATQRSSDRASWASATRVSPKRQRPHLALTSFHTPNRSSRPARITRHHDATEAPRKACEPAPPDLDRLEKPRYTHTAPPILFSSPPSTHHLPALLHTVSPKTRRLPPVAPTVGQEHGIVCLQRLAPSTYIVPTYPLCP